MQALWYEIGTEDHGRPGCIGIPPVQGKSFVLDWLQELERIRQESQEDVFEAAKLPAGIFPVFLPLPVR